MVGNFIIPQHIITNITTNAPPKHRQMYDPCTAQLAHQPKSQSLDNTHWNYTILLLYLEGGQKRCLLRDQIEKKSKKSKKSKLSQKVLDKSKISNRFKIRKMQNRFMHKFFFFA